MIEVVGKYNTAKVFTDTLEEKTYAQLLDLCNQEFVSGSTIRIMPDTHVGMGCTIGTTMTITEKVVPGHVGVDIGCGVYVAKLTDREIDFAKLDKIIRQNVPAGFSVRQKVHHLVSDSRVSQLRCLSAIKNTDRIALSLGSLGGGNHFIEVAVDESNNHYLLIHTGSRNLGKQIADYYQKLALDTINSNNDIRVETILQLKAEGKEQEIEASLAALKIIKVSKDMAYLEGQNLEDYLHDMEIAQEFADLNRQAIASVIFRGMNWDVVYSFITTHNYIEPRSNILRKGAVSAYKGQQLVIPINMRDGSILAEGKGNADWNYSAPHGAGRLMSRSQAKRELTMDEYRSTMDGIFTTSVDESTLDEAPMAYKPMQQILDAIGDTVEILHIVKPVYNFKSGGE